MLGKLWARRGPKVAAEERLNSPSQCVENHPETTHSRSGGLSRYEKEQSSDTHIDGVGYLASFANPDLDYSFTGISAAEEIPSFLLDDQLFGPFIPSVDIIGNGMVYDKTGKRFPADLSLVDMGFVGY